MNFISSKEENELITRQNQIIEESFNCYIRIYGILKVTMKKNEFDFNILITHMISLL